MQAVPTDELLVDLEQVLAKRPADLTPAQS